uniref:Uncharacterized protein n=1 Tax=Physcomitrium patens TaxID=3218 RepID=A0A2K1KC00_PHYPA|nr:hypothetical protein PHYPA_010478 [Physcomitrium patens]
MVASVVAFLSFTEHNHRLVEQNHFCAFSSKVCLIAPKSSKATIISKMLSWQETRSLRRWKCRVCGDGAI